SQYEFGKLAKLRLVFLVGGCHRDLLFSGAIIAETGSAFKVLVFAIACRFGALRVRLCMDGMGMLNDQYRIVSWGDCDEEIKMQCVFRSRIAGGGGAFR